MEVLLSNGQKVLVNVLTSDQTEDVLEVRCMFSIAPLPSEHLSPPLKLAGWISCPSCSQAVAAKLDLPDDLIGYFSLFLVREKEDGSFSCECLWPSLLPAAVPSDSCQSRTFPPSTPLVSLPL